MAKKRDKVIVWKKKEKGRGDSKRETLKKSAKKRLNDLVPKTTIVSPTRVSPQDLLKELTEAIKRGDTDPLIREMAKYAVGDVVALGLMSQEQFDELEEYDEDGNVVRQSGRMRALEMLPAKVRAQVLCDITPYFLAKKGTGATNTGGPKPKVTFYIPENGRPVRDNS